MPHDDRYPPAHSVRKGKKLDVSKHEHLSEANAGYDYTHIVGIGRLAHSRVPRRWFSINKQRRYYRAQLAIRQAGGFSVRGRPGTFLLEVCFHGKSARILFLSTRGDSIMFTGGRLMELAGKLVVKAEGAVNLTRKLWTEAEEQANLDIVDEEKDVIINANRPVLPF